MSFLRKRPTGMVLAALVVLSTTKCGPVMEDDDGYRDSSHEGEGSGPGHYGNTAANRAWWRNMPQSERDQRILDRAARDIGRVVGLNCKQWARLVIADASNGAVEIPPTYPDAYGWQWYQGAGVAGMNADIRNARPGWVVQMNIPTGSGGITPHTAIVAGVSSNGINWVDSNYVDSRSTPNKVGTHFQTFADFERATFIGGRHRYAVYTVVGTY